MQPESATSNVPKVRTWPAWLILLFAWLLAGSWALPMLGDRVGYTVKTAFVFYGWVFMALLFTAQFLASANVWARRHRPQVLLAAISLSLTIFCVDLVLRVVRIGALYSEGSFWNGRYSSPYTPYSGNMGPGLPNISYQYRTLEFGYTCHTNAQGYHDPRNFAQVADSATFRILALGDSFTQGVGAPADSCWPRLLERELNGNGQAVQVLNAGIAGSDPWFLQRYLPTLLQQTRPAMAVLCTGGFDILDLLIRGGGERFAQDGNVRYRTPPNWEWMFAYSYVFRLFMQRVWQYDQNLIRANQLSARRELATQQLVQALTKVDSVCKAAGVPLTLLFVPMYHEVVNDGYQSLGPRQQHALRRRTQCSIVDILHLADVDGRLQASNVAEYFWSIDRHPTSKGYALIANLLAEDIKARKVVGRDSTCKK